MVPPTSSYQKSPFATALRTKSCQEVVVPLIPALENQRQALSWKPAWSTE